MVVSKEQIINLGRKQHFQAGPMGGIMVENYNLSVAEFENPSP